MEFFISSAAGEILIVELQKICPHEDQKSLISSTYSKFKFFKRNFETPSIQGNVAF